MTLSTPSTTPPKKRPTRPDPDPPLPFAGEVPLGGGGGTRPSRRLARLSV